MNKRYLIICGLVLGLTIARAEMISIGGWHAIGSDPADFIEETPAQAMSDGTVMAMEGGTVLPEMTITELIRAQASALNNDPVKIFEFVRNRIGYELYYGCLKGAEGTLLSGYGNDVDQCALLGSLLKAADDSIEVSYIRGNVVYSGEFSANLIGCPTNYLYNLNPWFLMNAPVQRTDGWEFNKHYWLQANIGGTIYQLDPAFVRHEAFPVAAETLLTETTGYVRTNLLNIASNGATIFTAEQVQNVNESAVEETLRGYVAEIRQAQKDGNPDVEHLVGQRSVQQQILSVLNTNLPPDMVRVVSSSVLSSLPDTMFARYELTHSSGFAATAVKGYELAGKRLTLFYDSANGNRPVLRLDGVEKARGTVNLASNQQCTLYIKVVLPSEIHTNTYTYSSTASRTSTVSRCYSVVSDFLTASPKVLAQQSRKLAAYRAQGLSDSSEEVLGTTLHLMGLFYCRQNTLQNKLLSRITGVPALGLYQSGVVAQEAGYFIDLPLLGISYFSGMPNASSLFKASSFFASGLEHGMLEQIMGPEHPGISSTKGIALNNAADKHTYYATTNNWTQGLNIRSLLVGYTTDQKSRIDSDINNGFKFLLPRYTVSVGEWTGITYFKIKSTSLGAIISGAYGTQNGGYSGYRGYVPPPIVNTVTRTTYIPPPPPPVQIYRPKSIEPVDLYSGDYLFENSDLVISGPLPLELSRHYNSGQTSAGGVMGPGWGHSLQIEIDEHSSGDFAFGERDTADAAAVLAAQMIALDLMRNEDNAKGWTTAAIAAKWALDSAVENVLTVRFGESGRQFTRLPDGGFNAPPGSTDELTQTNGVYVLKERNANKYTFNTNNLIAQIADPDGNTLTFSYNAQTNLQSVASSFGPLLTFAYYNTTGSLISVTDNSSPARSVQYQYDTKKNLTNFVDAASKKWGIAYSNTNHPNAITSLTDPEGIVTIRNLYNSLGTVTQQVSATSNLWNFYTSDYQSIEKDPLGRQTIYQFDANGRTWVIRKSDESRIYSFYDSRNQITNTVNEAGVTNVFVYDNSHNLLTKREAIGTLQERVTGYGYDNLNRLRFVTNALGTAEQVVTEYTYTATHHVDTETQAKGASEQRITDYDYYSNGRLQMKTEPLRVTSYTHDSRGNPNTVTSTDAGTVDYDFSTAGMLEQVEDQNQVITKYGYNALGLLTNTIYAFGTPLQTSESQTYYGNRLLYTATDGRGKSITNTWTAAYKPATTRYPDGGLVSNTYDAADRMVLVKDARNNVFTNTLDAIGRVTYRKGPGSEGTEQRFFYDIAGNVTNNTVNPAGLNLWKVTAYDALNRPFSQQTAITGQQLFYDILGRATNRVDAASKSWETKYDALGQVKKTYRPSGNYEEYGYDAQGRRTLFYNAEHKPMHFGFDAQSRVTAITNAIGKVTSFTYSQNGNLTDRENSKNEITHYDYDVLSRLTNVVHEGVWKASFAYDANGNTTLSSNSVSRITYAYDEMNRMKGSTQSVRSVSSVVQNLYDLNGNRTNIVYPGGLNIGYSYDEENRLVGVTSKYTNHTESFSFGYDGASRFTSISYPNGVSSAFGYDAENRVTNYTHGAFLSHAIIRDPRGFKTREDIYSGLVPNFTNGLHQTRTHNDADQLLSAGSDAYAYDPNGNLTNSAGITYGWDYNNRLVNSGVTEYLYDGSGARIGRIANGVTNHFVLDYHAPLKMPLAETDAQGNITRYYVWSSHGLLAHLDMNPTSGAVVSTCYYHADEQGSTLALTDESGAVTDQFAYSPYGKILGRTGTNSTPYLWLGGLAVRNEGNGLYYMLNRYYSAEQKRFISTDPSGIDGGVNLYAYGNLNPLYYTDPSGNIPVPVITAIYGAIAGAVSGGITGYAYDGWNGVGKGVLVGAGAGALTGALMPQTSHIAASAAVAGLFGVAESAFAQQAVGLANKKSWSAAAVEVDWTQAAVSGLAAGFSSPASGGFEKLISSQIPAETAKMTGSDSILKIIGAVGSGAINANAQLGASYINSQFQSAKPATTVGPTIWNAQSFGTTKVAK